MMLGVGLYAPCLILVSLLGMSPLVAFPIMMGSCALLMPVGGTRFVRTRRYHPGAALGLDRKSTRLNSSHLVISYAVFCLKKKNHGAVQLYQPFCHLRFSVAYAR